MTAADLIGMPVFYLGQSTWEPGTISAARGQDEKIDFVSVTVAGQTVVDPPFACIKARDEQPDNTGVTLRAFCSGCNESKPRGQLRAVSDTADAVSVAGDIRHCHGCRMTSLQDLPSTRRTRSTQADLTQALSNAKKKKRKRLKARACNEGLANAGPGLDPRPVCRACPAPEPIDADAPSQARHSVSTLKRSKTGRCLIICHLNS